MRIRGVVTCVGLAPLLARGIVAWQTGLERMVVVTAPDDAATQTLCGLHNVDCYTTDIFTANGARFNKGAALSQAIIDTDLRDGAEWLLTFDCDIVPLAGWHGLLGSEALTPGWLYGARRYWQPEHVPHLVIDRDHLMPQSWVIGFFMLFHNADVTLPPPNKAVFDLGWPHAGNYDTIFCRKWPAHRQKILPIPFIHLGEERKNWLGPDSKSRADLQALLQGRRSPEDWHKEWMANPPKVGD